MRASPMGRCKGTGVHLGHRWSWRARPARFALAAALAGTAALQTGCAHVYVDADGARHIVGLVWLQLPPASAEPNAGEALRTRSLGLTLTLSDAGNALTLGYSDITLAFLRNDSVVTASALLLDIDGDAYRPAARGERP